MSDREIISKLLDLNESILQQLDELKQDVARRNSPWMKAREAAAYVGLSYSRFSSIYKDKIPYSHPVDMNPRFHKDDLDKFLKENTVEIY